MTENGENHTFTGPLGTVRRRDAKPEVVPPGQIKEGLMGKPEMGTKLSLTCFFPRANKTERERGRPVDSKVLAV